MDIRRLALLHTRTRLAALALAAALTPAIPAAAIVLDDPATFQVKHMWSATSLGIPGPLGALVFAADGLTLYVVGASESSISALYAVPVTRDAATNAVVDLGPAASVTKVFSGNPTTAGLDAGFDFGPTGTLFYTYWSANYLGERPGGVGGAETRFDMAKVGVPSSIAGLTFSPHVLDPATGFGQLQISSWSGANLYDVPLTPAGDGVFTPGPVQIFVTLPKQGTGAIQYVPSGPSAGDLMYVNWNFGEVRILTIDPATGLPIDTTTGLPTRGTASPEDRRFASDLGTGPWGLEFDPRTNDFFLGTWSGKPTNTIIQIGGFPKTEKCDNGVDDDDDGLVDCDDPSCGAAAACGQPDPTPTATPAATVVPTPVPTAAAPRDAFDCYKAPAAKGTAPRARTVDLADVFAGGAATIGTPQLLCAPSAKDGATVGDPTANLRCYKLKPAQKLAKRTVIVANEFGAETVIVAKPQLLCVPTEIAGTPSDLGIDHFECYKAKTAKGTPKFAPRGAQLADRFAAAAVVIAKPQLLCTPVSKDGTVLHDPAARLRCYKGVAAKKACALDAPQHAGQPCKQERDCGGEKAVTALCGKQAPFAKQAVVVENELGQETATVGKRQLLCVPSETPAP